MPCSTQPRHFAASKADEQMTEIVFIGSKSSGMDAKRIMTALQAVEYRGKVDKFQDTSNEFMAEPPRLC